MKKFARFIVHHHKIIIGLYLVVLLVSAFAMQYVTINSDLSSYLPDNTMTKKGEKILREEFDMLGQGILAIQNKELYEVADTVENIKSIEGVHKVTWLGDYEDIKKPIGFMNEKSVDKFIKEDAYILYIFLEHSNNSSQSFAIMDEINHVVEGDYYLGGPAMQSKEGMESALKELPKYLVLGVIIIFFILMASTSSYFEPIFFLITIGVSVVINMGTNIFLDDVSSITFSATAILQLALSMDYSIFLLHTFHDERSKGHALKASMINAIAKTFSSVSASALTTVGGFSALLLMRYGMGADLGVVLGKGVFFSLIAVLTLQPCLIILFDKLIEKYTHKVYLPSFKKVAGMAVKYRHIIMIIALILMIPTFKAQSKVTYNYLVSTNHQEENPLKEVVDNLGTQAILIVPHDNKVTHEHYIQDIQQLEYVRDMTGLYTLVDHTIPQAFIPEEVIHQYTTDEYAYYMVELIGGREDQITLQTVDELDQISQKYFNDYYITGDTQAVKDLSDVTPDDFVKVSIASVIIIFIILMLTFKSIKFPILLVLVIQLGIWINLSITYFMGTSINFISYIIISAIQLGATIDYAILLTDKYRHFSKKMSTIDAVKQAVHKSGQSILVSAMIILSACLCVHYMTSNVAVGEVTLLIGRGAVISTILVILLLPALFVITNKKKHSHKRG